MRLLNQVVNDAALTPEEFREVRKAVIEKRYVNLSGREVLPVRNVSIGRQEYGFDVLSEKGVADVIAKATNFPAMDIDKTRTLTYIMKHGIAFSIAREDLLSSREHDEALNTIEARRASRLTQNKENSTIISGNTLYGINGIYDGAGKTEAGSDWGTNDPTVDILDAMNQLDSEFKPTDLLLHSTQYLQLYRRTSGTDKTYMEIIRGLGITPRIDRDMAEGTGLLMEAGSDIAELIVAEELDIEEDYVLENQSYRFNTFLRSVPVIYQVNALCKLTGI